MNRRDTALYNVILVLLEQVSAANEQYTDERNIQEREAYAVPSLHYEPRTYISIVCNCTHFCIFCISNVCMRQKLAGINWDAFQ